MPDYIRVKLSGTGHKVTVFRSQFDPEGMTELKQDAVDEHGAPLPAEFATKSPSSQSGQKKATTTTKES